MVSNLAKVIIAAAALAKIADATNVYITMEQFECDGGLDPTNCPCFQAEVVDNQGNQFYANCGAESDCCAGNWNQQPCDHAVNVGGGYYYCSDGSNAIIQYGGYNYYCQPNFDGNVEGSCTLGGTTKA